MNPVVAVLVGWGLAAEPIGVFALVAMVIILLGVALVNAGRREEQEPERDSVEEELAARRTGQLAMHHNPPGGHGASP